MGDSVNSARFPTGVRPTGVHAKPEDNGDVVGDHRRVCGFLLSTLGNGYRVVWRPRYEDDRI
jgi:hypothetical protein